MNSKRFRIAFSFAGEKRDFVAKVAHILAVRFGEPSILYDKYHEAEFGRSDLGIYLPELYHKQSDLVVIIICPDYGDKEWTGLEWTAIHDLLKKRKIEEILLTRFDHAELKGLYSNAGFVELDDKTPEQAATVILERLALNEGRGKDHYTKPATVATKPLSTSIPNNLPRIRSFFGRENELAAIREALDPENRTWGALIDGPGGMGKTSLAVRAAYECMLGRFQRIVFLSVKDREMDDDGERRLTGFLLPGFLEMLNELARELGQPDIPKSTEDQRIRLLHDALREAPALLVLDNLESLPKSDRDQLLTFVKRLPQGSKAIITSRRRIGSGSELVPLEKLDQAAALAILADLSGHNKLLAKTSEPERVALYGQTGGSPLLLRWMAGQLGRGSCRTFSDALHFLGTCPPDNDPLEFIFGDLVEEFTVAETQVLCALTYFSLPAKVEHIADVADLEITQAEVALRSLANRSLVIPDQEERAFALTPMVAEFIRRKRPEIIATTGDQLERHAYDVILENGFDQHDRFPTLIAAWPTLTTALPRFLAGPNRRLQVVCNALHKFLEFDGHWDEWLSLSQLSETKAMAECDLICAGWNAYRQGRIYSLRRQAHKTLECADRAAQHWLAGRCGPRELATAILLRGHACGLLANHPAAIAAYREAIAISRNMSPVSVEVAVALNWLAGAELEAGEQANAEQDGRESLRMARTLGYEEGIASALANLAGAAMMQEDWPEAEKLAREALTLSKKINRRDLTAGNCLHLANCLSRQKKNAKGLPFARHAVELLTELNSPLLVMAQEALRECQQ